MGELTVGEPVRFLPCLHCYHVECIDDWLLRSLTCPSCLEPVDAALLSSYQSPWDSVHTSKPKQTSITPPFQWKNLVSSKKKRCNSHTLKMKFVISTGICIYMSDREGNTWNEEEQKNEYFRVAIMTKCEEKILRKCRASCQCILIGPSWETGRDWAHWSAWTQLKTIRYAIVQQVDVQLRSMTIYPMLWYLGAALGVGLAG